MLTLYVYDIDTRELVGTIMAETNAQCESMFASKYDAELFEATYVPRDNDGLIAAYMRRRLSLNFSPY
jgi:hypothetical protein